MPKTAIDYSKCVIYKICCKDPSITYEYYGHTTNVVNRKKLHKSTCNNKNYKSYDFKIYQMIRENGNWNNWDFVIVEDYPCQNMNEAKLRERYWIELKQPQLNTYIPNRTPKEYVEDNRDRILKYKKEHRQKNYTKKINCECGSITLRESLRRHVKSQKHINYLNLKKNVSDEDEEKKNLSVI